MARDYTKYKVEGLGENLNKRSLVFNIVKDWIQKNNPSFEDLQNAFPDEVQGSQGFIRRESEVTDLKRFNMREPLKIKNGAHVVVSNQWGDNIDSFIAVGKKLGYSISSQPGESNANDLNGKSSFVFIEFGVFSDEGEQLELEFKDYFNIDLSKKVDCLDYERILKDQNILLSCKNTIQDLDFYFLENGRYYKLRILKIGELDLRFLWDKNFDDYDEDTLPIDDLIYFFRLETKEQLLGDFEDIISDFDSDNMTSLEFLNSL